MNPRPFLYLVAGIALFWVSSVSAQFVFFNIPDGNVTLLKNAIATSNSDGKDASLFWRRTGLIP